MAAEWTKVATQRMTLATTMSWKVAKKTEMINGKKNISHFTLNCVFHFHALHTPHKISKDKYFFYKLTVFMMIIFGKISNRFPKKTEER